MWGKEWMSVGKDGIGKKKKKLSKGSWDWIFRGRSEKKEVAWGKVQIDIRLSEVFLENNRETLLSWILIRTETSRYFPLTFACLLLLMESQSCSQYGYGSMGCITLSDVIFMSLSWISFLQTSHCLPYKDINGNLMCLLANEIWHRQTVS